MRCLVSDRAKALLQRAEQGLECLSIPDVLHLVHAIVKSSSLAIGRQLRQARQALQQAEDRLQRHQERGRQHPAAHEATRQVEVTQRAVRHWEPIQGEYRQRLETLSLPLPPFALADAAPQTSMQVESRGQAQVEAMAALAHMQQWPDRQATMKKVKKQIPALAALVDLWWAGVRQAVEQAASARLWATWAQETLLPKVSWEHHGARTRCAQRKAKRQQALEMRSRTVATHALTRCLPPPALGEWYAWATRQVQAWQRASSAVEGRNGSLAQLHYNQRGLPTQRYKVWAVLHNFDGRAVDGTTPAARFFRRTVPALFETVLSHIHDVPLPRHRKHAIALKH